MIAGAGNVVIFNRICSRRARKVTSAAAGCGLRFHGRIMVGWVSDHGRIGRALERHFDRFRQISLRFGSAILRGRRNIW